MVLDVKTGLLYPLNAVATRIWELCDGGRSVAAIAETITGEFDAEETTIRSDVLAFVEALASARLVTVSDRQGVA